MKKREINVIITGATGMVGEGVLHQCLTDARIATVTLLSRRSSGVDHPKIREVILPNLFSVTGEEKGLQKADACFYCLGTTSMGKTEEEYTWQTLGLTLTIAKALQKQNPEMTFCYVSAKGVDTSEVGDYMWARIKGKTENALIQLQFKNFYAFRPHLLSPIKGMTHTHGFYKLIAWFFPLGRVLNPKGFCTLREMALAMIKVGYQGYCNTVVNVTDMVELSKE